MTTRTSYVLMAWAALGCVLTGCGKDSTEAFRFEPADRVAYATSIILVEGKPKREWSEARARAWDLWHMVRNGTPFAKVASQNSEDESRKDGGFMGFVTVGPDSALSGAMQAMAPGTISRPVKTMIGYQIFYRHPFDEAVRKERELGLWMFGMYIQYGENIGRTREQSGQLAERLVAQLKTGETTLPAVLKKYREGQRVPMNGFLGFTYDRKGRRGLYEPLSQVPEGAFVGPIDTNRGWAILQRGRALRALAGNILIQDNRFDLSISRSPEQARALAEKLIAELRADPSKWNRIVANHSDDRGSRSRQGLMDPITPGIWPEPFEEAVRNASPGTLIPTPVQTEYGWHIVKRFK